MPRSRALRAFATTSLAASCALPASSAHAEDTFTPTRNLDLAALTTLVAKRSPGTEADRLGADLARADARQARLYGNPTVDGTWGTIPLGQTNPPGLARWTDVPSYGVGVSYTFSIGKRDARIRRADAVVEAARANVAVGARQQALDLARTLGQMAVALLRVEGLRSQIEEQRQAIGVAESRLATGFGTPLDVDRLRIELSRTEQQLVANEADLRAAGATCSAISGLACRAFADAEEARAFLGGWIARAAQARAKVEDRPDVRALDASRRAAHAEADYAKALRIPDPTVRVGYLYDQFTISGNQRHSLSVSVSIPLPFLDGGEAARDAAAARRLRADAIRERVIELSRVRADALRLTLESREKRRAIIAGDMLPRARGVVADLERAATARLIPVTDVIQARRTLSELLVTEAESHGDAFQVSVDLLSETGAEAPNDLP